MKFLSLVVAFFVTQAAMSQDLRLDWGDKQTVDNAKDGLMDYFAGSTSKYIYMKSANFIIGVGGKRNKRVKLTCYDKTNTIKISQALLAGCKSEEKSYKAHKDLDFISIDVRENIIYIFWEKYDKKKKSRELFVESFDPLLKPIKSLKKIFSAKSKKKNEVPDFFVCTDKDLGDSVVIGSYRLDSKLGKFKIEYAVLHKDNTVNEKKSIDFTDKANAFFTSSVISFNALDGKTLSTNISYKETEKDALSKTTLMLVDISSGKSKYLEFKLDGKHSYSSKYFVKDGKIKLFGFYSDTKQEKQTLAPPSKKGKKAKLDAEVISGISGIYFQVYDLNTLTLESTKTNAFTKEQLKELYKQDKDDFIEDTKNKKSTLAIINGQYTIEDVVFLPEGEMILLTSIMKNIDYTVTTVNTQTGATSTRSVVYCEKHNVTLFKINENVDFIWSKNIDRKALYPNMLYVNDLEFITHNNSVYVTYGSSFDEKAKKRRKRKSFLGTIDYASFDITTGASKVENIQVNEGVAKKRDQKRVLPTFVESIDNRFYVHSIHARYKVGLTIITYIGMIGFPYCQFFANFGYLIKADEHVGIIQYNNLRTTKK